MRLWRWFPAQAMLSRITCNIRVLQTLMQYCSVWFQKPVLAVQSELEAAVPTQTRWASQLHGVYVGAGYGHLGGKPGQHCRT